jgi:hypothetical protein
MLSEQSVGSVLTLSEKLAEANVVAEPVPATPLAELQTAAYSPMLEAKDVNDLDSGALFQRLVEATQQKGLDGKVAHDVVMEQVVEVVAKNVQNNLQIARNVVNPIIKQTIELVEKEIHDADIKAVNLLNVIADEFRSLWNNNAVEGMVDRYSQTAMEDLSVEHVFPAMEGASLLELLSTGASRLDDEIKQWAASFPEGYLVDIYNSFFVASKSGQPEKFSQYFSQNNDRDSILAIHLIARRLEKNIPEGVNMDITAFRGYIVNVQAQSGRALCRIYEKRVKDSKSKQLIKAWPAISADQLGGVDSVILVNADIYNDWLSAGGCPEILFGAFLLDRNGDFNSLIEKKDEYLAAWKRQAVLLGSRAQVQRFNVTVNAIRRVVTRLINDTTIEQLPIASRGSLHERLAHEISEITAKDLEDLPGTLREIICETMYPHTDAEDILESIDEIASQNPGMDIREVALLATIDHVVDWVAHLIKVRVIQLNV